MTSITFKAKVRTMHDVHDTPLYEYIIVPEFKKSHCNMQAFRQHVKYGGYANSDLFAGILARIRRELLQGRAYLRLDDLPDNVTVTEGFLYTITVEV